ncbi:MAG: dihydroxyacetone kinase subunit L [Deltaproteobacteria bacterium]|nr:dihydroxyacetone kinase subunit L [Deltaproteobacteria bacterium]
MNSKMIIELIREVQTAYEASASEIEKLDQAIGDGDHVFNMKRGIQAILLKDEELVSLKPGDALNKIGMILLSSIGGAAGPLFASMFMGMAKVAGSSDIKNVKTVAEMFASGVQLVKQRGKADVGDKTMMDVLIPVSTLFSGLVERGDLSKNEMLRQLMAEAERGMLSTKDIAATKGRASYLGERAKGHIDPGAKSCQLILFTICNYLINREQNK